MSVFLLMYRPTWGALTSMTSLS